MLSTSTFERHLVTISSFPFAYSLEVGSDLLKVATEPIESVARYLATADYCLNENLSTLSIYCIRSRLRRIYHMHGIVS